MGQETYIFVNLNYINHLDSVTLSHKIVHNLLIHTLAHLYDVDL